MLSDVKLLMFFEGKIVSGIETYKKLIGESGLIFYMTVWIIMKFVIKIDL